MYGNQCKAWFEVNARRVNADEIEKIKEAIKNETGLVNMKDPCTTYTYTFIKLFLNNLDITVFISHIYL